MEAQSKKISNYRCHFARFFTLIGAGINQQAGREAVARNAETKFQKQVSFCPLFPI